MIAPDDILMISATVLTLVQLLKWTGLEGAGAKLAVLLVSGASVGLWAWSQGALTDRALVWELFAAWMAVATSAAGIYGYGRPTGLSTTMR